MWKASLTDFIQSNERCLVRRSIEKISEVQCINKVREVARERYIDFKIYPHNTL
jgi:hypothetical protein